eukprot:8796410-Alexandrium_andersonii.AAC.1
MPKVPEPPPPVSKSGPEIPKKQRPVKPPPLIADMITKFGSPSDARAEDGQRAPKGRDVEMGDADHKATGETA